MDERKDFQINLREALQRCRDTIDGFNSNYLVAMLRGQNEMLNNALNIVEKYLSAAEELASQDVSDVGVRVATLFIIGLWAKLRKGISIAELTEEDWDSIKRNAFGKAMDINPQDFSSIVFNLYRKSITYAALQLQASASLQATSRLEEIVDIMDEYEKGLKNGIITETKYIEENLWLSIEAVYLVLLSNLNYSILPEERQELIEAISSLVFQSIRYGHHDRELKAVDACIKYQDKLDERLSKQVYSYIDELRHELDEFDLLVEKTFVTTDFQSAFRGSIELADLIGARTILRSEQDIDDYFLS